MTNDTIDRNISENYETNKISCGGNAYDESTCSGNSDYEVFEESHKNITSDSIFWAKLKK